MTKSALQGVGLQQRKIANQDTTPYILYEYKAEDGSFDYERYRKIQTEGNRLKIDKRWVVEENIKFLSDYLLSEIGRPEFGICHGTRRGLEQEWFRKYLSADVIGTEISDTAADFPHTIQWDFHEIMPEWIDRFDFIYSNSLDHSYDPKKCLNAWMSCLRPGGLCLLEHSVKHGPRGASELDPFGAELTLMPYLIAIWGDGQYYVRRIIRAPAKKDERHVIDVIVIQRADKRRRQER